MDFLTILLRWVHVVTACVAVGGVFFVCVVLPIGLGVLPPEQKEAAFLKTRRVFKMVFHTAILLLIISGTYNTIANFPKYNLQPFPLHMILAIHLLLALVAFSIAIYVLAGKTPRANHRKLMAINLIILFLVVAAASTLKSAREKAVAQHVADQSAMTK